MINPLQGNNLSLHGFSLHTIIQFSLLIYLNSILLHGTFMITHIYHSIGPLANGLANLIIFQYAHLWFRRPGMCLLSGVLLVVSFHRMGSYLSAICWKKSIHSFWWFWWEIVSLLRIESVYVHSGWGCRRSILRFGWPSIGCYQGFCLVRIARWFVSLLVCVSCTYSTCCAF